MTTFNICMAGITCTRLTEKLSFNELVCFIKDHPEKSLIKALHAREYKGYDYRRQKEHLPYVMPHASFYGQRKLENVDQPTGYIYLDIDKSDLPDGPEVMKEEILQKHADKVSLMGTSVGGGGIFLYVRIANPEVLTTENFTSAYHFVRTVLFNGIPTDGNASGIARTHIIPYDPEVYTNPNVEVLLPDSVLHNTKLINSCNNISKLGYTASDKFLDIKNVLSRMKTQTIVDVGELSVLVKDVEYCKLYVPKVIRDGRKHATYRAMVDSIKFLNPDFSLLDILSYINYVNAKHTDGKPMSIREMKRTVEAEYERVVKTGDFKTVRIKRYHSTPRDNRITRIRNVARVRGEESIKNSIALITEAVHQLKEEGCERPTIKKLAGKLKGRLSEASIGRHWRNVVPKRLV